MTMSGLTTIQRIMERITALEKANESLRRDVDALRDAKETKAFFNVRRIRDGNVPDRPIPRRKKLHLDVYYAYADDPDVYAAKTLLEFAGVHQVEYSHGLLDLRNMQICDETERLRAEAKRARAQLNVRGIDLRMFGGFLSRAYKPVPHLVLWGDQPKSIQEWIEENDCVILETYELEHREDDDRDPKKRLDRCMKCSHRTETEGRLIACDRHEAVVPRFYTAADRRNYIESAQKVCDYPKCFERRSA